MSDTETKVYADLITHLYVQGIPSEDVKANKKDVMRIAEATVRKTEELFMPACEGVVNHGPGHQSKSRCTLKGEHEYHHATNGYSAWEWPVSEGLNLTTGYFDDSEWEI